MSSLQIAKRTGKRHADVIRDIRKILQVLGTERKFASSYFDPTGRALACYNLPERECQILISGYSVELRAAIIDRQENRATSLSSPKINSCCS